MLHIQPTADHRDLAVRLRRSSRRLAVVAALGLAVGCQTLYYRAAQLPPEYLAPPASRVRELDLTRLAGQGEGTSKIGPGDLVELTVASGRGEEAIEPISVRVAHDGRLAVPLVGWVPVAGLEPAEAEQRIVTASIERGVYRQPSVTLQVTEQAVNRVTVLGAVMEPGVYPLPRGSCDLANAIAAAGGLTEEAGTQVDVLRHESPTFFAEGAPADSPSSDGVALTSYEAGNSLSWSPSDATAARPGPPAKVAPRTVRIDLAQAEPYRENHHQLNDRDVVLVLPQEKQLIHVTGLVKRADQFTLSRDQDVRLLDAIAMAGGISSPIADKVVVIRHMENMPEPVIIRTSIRKAKRDGNENLRLAPGDLVSVEVTPATMVYDTANTFFRMTLGIGSSVTIF